MSTDSHTFGPSWRKLAGIALALEILALLIWLDANRLPEQMTVGVGPSAAMRLVALFVAVLYLIASTLSEVLYAALDPRVRS